MTIDGHDYVGSAQFCADSHLVLTAAHCVKDRETGSYAENVVFKRAFKKSSYGQNIPIHSIALKGWWTTYESGYYNWDYAFGVTRSSSDVDYLEYMLYSESQGVATTMGYPGNFYDGDRMVKTTGAYKKIGLLSEPSEQSGRWNMDGNPMSNGSSGGAWFDPLTKKVISVTSTGNDSAPNLQGPIFTEDFESLVKYAKKLID